MIYLVTKQISGIKHYYAGYQAASWADCGPIFNRTITAKAKFDERTADVRILSTGVMLPDSRQPRRKTMSHVVHKVGMVSPDGVSPLCAKKPRLTNSWTVLWRLVTCKKCLALRNT